MLDSRVEVPWRPGTLRSAIHYCFYHVAELLRRVLVALQVSGDAALPIYDHRMQGVSQEAFILPGIHAEFSTDLIHLSGTPGQKVPGLVVLRPRPGIVGQSLRLVMFGIEGDAEQDQVFSHPIGKTLMKNSEIVRHAETKIRKGTSGVDKRNSNYLTL